MCGEVRGGLTDKFKGTVSAAGVWLGRESVFPVRGGVVEGAAAGTDFSRTVFSDGSGGKSSGSAIHRSGATDEFNSSERCLNAI